MDFINHNEMWGLQGGDYCFGDNSTFDAYECQWNGVSQSEDRSYMLSGETTPVKACGDFGYYASNNGSKRKGLEECGELSSRAKRRRVLQFDSEVIDVPDWNEGISSTHLRSNEMGDSVEEVLSEVSRWLSDDSDGPSIGGSEAAMNQFFEGWLTNCLNDDEMKLSPEYTDISGQSDFQSNNTTELYNKPHGYEATMFQAPVRSHQNVVFKGRKSYMQTPDNSGSSIVYPFTIVKPCSFHGDVTINDINQRIHGPRYKQIKKDPEDFYPTSAFSGKPVVAKTRICTEGGKGSITIMRTKG